jgi:hypothetical protein
MPRLSAPITAASCADVFLTTDPTRWELLLEAVQIGPFFATKALQIAQRSPKFRGGDTAARAQADKLVAAGVLERQPNGQRVLYGAGPKGRAIYTRLLQLQHARPVRTVAESRVLAVIARVEQSDYDAFELGGRVEIELLADLRSRTMQAQRRVQISELKPQTGLSIAAGRAVRTGTKRSKPAGRGKRGAPPSRGGSTG